MYPGHLVNIIDAFSNQKKILISVQRIHDGEFCINNVKLTWLSVETTGIGVTRTKSDVYSTIVSREFYATCMSDEEFTLRVYEH